jgi:hypothetical protein
MKEQEDHLVLSINQPRRFQHRPIRMMSHNKINNKSRKMFLVAGSRKKQEKG